MRTNIEIDDELMRKAIAASGAPTKKAVVEEALQMLVTMKAQGEALGKLWGIGVWRGHDDDWFASDEEILRKRNQAAQEAVHDNPPAAEQVSELAPR